MSSNSIVFIPENWAKDLSDRFDEILQVYMIQVKERFKSQEILKDYPNLDNGFKEL